MASLLLTFPVIELTRKLGVQLNARDPDQMKHTHTMTKTSRPKIGAFTLIELLVVIAIIVILASLL